MWIWGLTKTFGGTLPAPPANAAAAASGAFPLTHLWFLYYLLVLYVVVVARSPRASWRSIAADAIAAARADAVVRGVVRSGVAAVVLALPLAAALYVREQLDHRGSASRRPISRSFRSWPRWSATAPRSHSAGWCIGRSTCSTVWSAAVAASPRGALAATGGVPVRSRPDADARAGGRRV